MGLTAQNDQYLQNVVVFVKDSVALSFQIQWSVLNTNVDLSVEIVRCVLISHKSVLNESFSRKMLMFQIPGVYPSLNIVVWKVKSDVAEVKLT